MAIRFEDTSPVADFLRNEFQDTVLNVTRSLQASDEKKEKEQQAEELKLTKIRATNILNDLESASKNNNTLDPSEIDRFTDGIAALRATDPDSKIIKATEDGVQKTFNNVINQQYDTMASINEIKNIQNRAERALSAEYQSGDLDSLISDLNNVVMNVGGTYSSNVIDRTQLKTSQLLDQVTLLNNLKKEDVSEEDGLQLDEAKTKLGIVGKTLDGIDGFQSNTYQELIKSADSFMKRGDYKFAAELFDKAKLNQTQEASKARDIQNLLDIFYSPEGELKEEFVKRNANVFDGYNKMVQVPFVDLLNTAINDAQAGNFDQSKKNLNLIPKSIRASENALNEYKLREAKENDKIEEALMKETSIKKTLNINQTIKDMNPSDVSLDGLSIKDKTKIREVFDDIKNWSFIKTTKIPDAEKVRLKYIDINKKFADMFVTFESEDTDTDFSPNLVGKIKQYASATNEIDKELASKAIVKLIKDGNEIENIDLKLIGKGSSTKHTIFRNKLRQILTLIDDYEVLDNNLNEQ